MKSLNPCSNGIWSLTKEVNNGRTINSCLNPCSNGIWSLTEADFNCEEFYHGVLILVLMEYGL